jgi:hypothetical protein
VELTIAEVLVHTPIRGSLGTLHTLSNECLSSAQSQSTEGGRAYRLQSLIGNLLDFNVHRSLLSLFISLFSYHQEGRAYGHDNEDHLGIFPRLHVCLSSSITESNFDTSQIELGVLLDDFGFFVGDGTSTLDENSHELGDEVFCKSALESFRRQ